MFFRRAADALLFHSSTRLTSEQDAATLERAWEDARWREYDEPAYLRRQRNNQEISNVTSNHQSN